MKNGLPNKPKAPKNEPRRYRNLSAFRRSIWYECRKDGKRVREDLKTTDWEAAVEIREALETRLGTSPIRRLHVPTFAEEAKATLATMEMYIGAGAEEAVATTTARDLRGYLAVDGPVVRHLGDYRLDEIDPAVLMGWHERECLARKLSHKTVQNYLGAIERVLRHARNRGELSSNHRPVSVFSERVRSDKRTKRARARRDEQRRAARDGVLTVKQVGALYAAAREEGLEAEVVVGLAVECGLRRGEISAATWGWIHWGAGPGDPARAIEVRGSNSGGLGTDSTKAGAWRRPHLSRRLYRALRRLHKERWEPGPDTRIVKRDYFDLSKLTLRRCLKRAGLPDRSFQHLRATCSSLLKQWGVAPGYVMAALGHAGEEVAAKHYDAIDRTVYRAPEPLGERDTPMDLFERLCPAPRHNVVEIPHKTPTTQKNV